MEIYMTPGRHIDVHWTSHTHWVTASQQKAILYVARYILGRFNFDLRDVLPYRF